MTALALALAAALAAPSAVRMENDWAAALAQARARKVPIFVDAWAPW